MKRSNDSVFASNKTHKVSGDYLNDADNEWTSSDSDNEWDEPGQTVAISLKRFAEDERVFTVKRARPAPTQYFDSDADDEQDSPKSFVAIRQDTPVPSDNIEVKKPGIPRTRALLDLSKLNEELDKIDENKVSSPAKKFTPVVAEDIVRPKSAFGSVGGGYSPTSAVSPFLFTASNSQSPFSSYRDRSDSFGNDDSDCEESLTI